MKRDRFTAILLAIAIMAAGGVARASISTPHVVSQKAAPVSVEVHCVADTAEISANTYDSAAYDDDPIFCTFLVNITEKRASIFAVWGAYILTEEELLEVMYEAGTDPAGYVDGQNLYAYYPGPNGVDALGLITEDEMKGVLQSFNRSEMGKALQKMGYEVTLKPSWGKKAIKEKDNKILVDYEEFDTPRIALKQLREKGVGLIAHKAESDLLSYKDIWEDLIKALNYAAKKEESQLEEVANKLSKTFARMSLDTEAVKAHGAGLSAGEIKSKFMRLSKLQDATNIANQAEALRQKYGPYVDMGLEIAKFYKESTKVYDEDPEITKKMKAFRQFRAGVNLAFNAKKILPKGTDGITKMLDFYTWSPPITAQSVTWTGGSTVRYETHPPLQ